MNILKLVVVISLVLLASGCTIVPGIYVYGSGGSGYIDGRYAGSKEVKKAYRDEQKKITVREKSIAACEARNAARIDMGLYPVYRCTLFGYGAYGYRNSYSPDYYIYPH